MPSEVVYRTTDHSISSVIATPFQPHDLQRGFRMFIKQHWPRTEEAMAADRQSPWLSETSRWIAR